MYQTQFVRGEFLERVHASSRSALLLDYDGTLAPFSEQRENALPYPEIPKIIADVMSSTCTRVVIVSGRSTREVVRLLGLDYCPEVWGAHGLERLLPDGTLTVGRVDRRSARAIDEAVQRVAAQGLQKYLERKAGGIALHWRGLGVLEAEEIFQLAMKELLPLTRSSRLSLSEFEGGIELRVSSCNKGRVVDEIAREMGDAPLAYLGDDRTDEDAFRALQGRGLTVLVRPELRPTSAELWLRPPEELLHFLNDWLTASRGER
jgi:trehalose 6-phosphate phosphatase